LKNINYIIYTPNYSINSGGYSALHYLSQALHELGVNSVYLTTNITNPRWYAVPLEYVLSSQCKKKSGFPLLSLLIWIREWIKIPTFIRKITRKVRSSYPNFVWQYLDRESTVVIYAENEPGNPLDAKNIVRWIMMHPKVESKIPQYGLDEHIFLYHDFYKVNERYNNQIKGLLTSIDMNYHLETYFDFHKERKGGAYIVRKGVNKPHDKHPEEFKNVDDLLLQLSDKEKAQFFNGIKTFISYDPVTFVTVQAALCGCEVIVIPDKDGEFSVSNMKKTNRINGVAYGLDDLEWARETLHLLKPSMEETNKQNLETISKFKDYWESYLGK
jgi:hypothetical protein